MEEGVYEKKGVFVGREECGWDCGGPPGDGYTLESFEEHARDSVKFTNRH